MSTAVGVGAYTRKTLVANWFEDRLAPGQPERDFPEMRSVRRKEADLRDVSKGTYAILDRIARNPPHVSTCTLDDGFRVTETNSQEAYQTPRKGDSKGAAGAATATFVTTETVPEVIAEGRRPMRGQASGFSAPLQRHGAQEGIRFFDTSYQVNYGVSPRAPRKLQVHQAASAGLSVLAAGPKGLRVGELTGEVLRKDADPSMNTKVQRAWTEDPAIPNLSYGGRKPEPPLVDNELSMKFGEGDLKRQMKEMEAKGGNFFLNASPLTSGKVNKPGIHLFLDG
jgi:hypothetical protein